MPEEEMQEAPGVENEDDNGEDQALLEALKQVFEALDRVEKKLDELVQIDKEVHKEID